MLTVTDEAGNADTDMVTATVRSADTDVASISAEDVSAQSGTEATVKFNLTNTASEQSGYILNLTLPGTWNVTSQSSDGGTWRASETKWLWQTIDSNQTVNPSITVAVPETANGNYSINTAVKTTDGVVAETNATIQVYDTLTINQAIDENNDGQIGDFEVLTAIEYWRTGEKVPQTDGKTIGDSKILKLIELWRTDETV
jgi:hypothetical protein